MLFKVVLLICAAHVPHGDCQEGTALTVLQGPEVGNVLECGLKGQAYFATSALGVEITPDEYLKTACRRTRTTRLFPDYDPLSKTRDHFLAEAQE